MTYVMSDIHGRYEKYREMLDKISLKDSDELYVIGDMIDIGNRPVDVLLDMSMRANVFPVLGDHEYMALKILKKMKKSDKNQKELSGMLEGWMKDGGGSTALGLAGLGEEDREALIEYLEEIPLYEEITVSGKRYILVHAGLANFSREKLLDDYTPEELVYEKTDMSKRYFDDATIVSGHTVLKADNVLQRKAVYGNGNISINCGETENEPLCAIRLDDGQEYYV